MSKLKISLHEPVHSLHYRVLYGDTDSGGVVYYGNYLRFFEAGRTEFMRDQGIPYSELEESGLILPVVENYIRYKASAKYDDQIVIQSSLVEVGLVSCRFNYKILRLDDEKLLVKGFTTHAVVDRSGKLVKFPKEVFSQLSALVKKA